MIAITSAAVTLRTIGFDALGRQVSTWEANDTSLNTDDVLTMEKYDSLGRLVEETVQISGPGTVKRVTATQFISEARTELAYPSGPTRGLDVSPGHGPARHALRHDSVSAAAPSLAYDWIGGRLLRQGMSNGTGLDMRNGSGTDYDGAGRPVRWAYRKGSQSGNEAMIGFRYTYDRTGNKLAQRSLHDPRDSQRYAYDSANRLTSYSRGAFDASEPTLLSASWCDTATTPAWSGMAQGARWIMDGAGQLARAGDQAQRHGLDRRAHRDDVQRIRRGRRPDASARRQWKPDERDVAVRMGRVRPVGEGQGRRRQ